MNTGKIWNRNVRYKSVANRSKWKIKVFYEKYEQIKARIDKNLSLFFQKYPFEY